jgi:outer membrane protein assembly factor BamD (BamD/ComL family)
MFYLKARKISPANPNIATNLCNLLIRQKQYDSVIRYTDQFIRENPKSYTVLRLGAFATYLKKDYPAAASRFRGSISNFKCGTKPPANRVTTPRLYLMQLM